MFLKENVPPAIGAVSLYAITGQDLVMLGVGWAAVDAGLAGYTLLQVSIDKSYGIMSWFSSD